MPSYDITFNNLPAALTTGAHCTQISFGDKIGNIWVLNPGESWNKSDWDDHTDPVQLSCGFDKLDIAQRQELKNLALITAQELKPCTDCGARPGMCAHYEGEDECTACDDTGACQTCRPNKGIDLAKWTSLQRTRGSLIWYDYNGSTVYSTNDPCGKSVLQVEDIDGKRFEASRDQLTIIE